MELSDKRVKQLMTDFDKRGDGALQLDQFVGVGVMQNRLDALAREEKGLALEKAKDAQMEAQAVVVASTVG
jgi:Ca2+-binding EF-hand superfamily protein